MTDCPTPQKVAHPTRQQADRALGRAWRQGRNAHLPCRAYHCPCGMWHLTSKPYQTYQERHREQ